MIKQCYGAIVCSLNYNASTSGFAWLTSMGEATDSVSLAGGSECAQEIIKCFIHPRIFVTIKAWLELIK